MEPRLCGAPRACPPRLPFLLLLLAVLVLLVVPLPPVPTPGAVAGASGSAQAGDGYRWPIEGRPPVTRPFDPPIQRWLPGHRGVDLGARPGAVVRAAGSGVVFFAGPVAGRGVVSVAHGDRLRTTYQPLTPVVSAGDVVTAGDPIGILEAGHAGCPVAACLHWGVRQGGRYLDPLALLGLARVRLLPVDGPGSRTTSTP